MHPYELDHIDESLSLRLHRDGRLAPTFACRLSAATTDSAKSPSALAVSLIRGPGNAGRRFTSGQPKTYGSQSHIHSIRLSKNSAGSDFSAFAAPLVLSRLPAIVSSRAGIDLPNRSRLETPIATSASTRR
jgi:hypothetical protein